MITIGIPVNMETTIKHLNRAGWRVTFVEEQGVEVVATNGKEGQIIRWRSLDIPLEVHGGADVGIVGSDCVKERKLQFPGLDIEILAEFDSYGRKLFGIKPRLELITFNNNPISNPEEIPQGSIIRTEYPFLTKEFLEHLTFKVAIMGETSPIFASPREFNLWCKEGGFIGIRRIGGQPESFASLGQEYYSTVVSETGKSLTVNPVKSIGTIEEIKMFLIVAESTLNDKQKEREITSLAGDLREAYRSILEGPQGSIRERI